MTAVCMTDSAGPASMKMRSPDKLVRERPSGCLPMHIWQWHLNEQTFWQYLQNIISTRKEDFPIRLAIWKK